MASTSAMSDDRSEREAVDQRIVGQLELESKPDIDRSVMGAAEKPVEIGVTQLNGPFVR